MPQNKTGSTTAIPIWFIAVTGVLLLARLIGYFVHSNAHPTTIAWKPPADAHFTSYEPQQPYIFEFSADWCGPCKQLEQKAFSNGQIVSLINEKFVPVRVLDRQKEDGKNTTEVAVLESKYHVYGFPTLVVALQNGTLVSQSMGVPSSYDVHQWLIAALKLADYTRGVSYMLDHDSKQAVTCFREALINPDWSVVKTNYAAAFLALCERLNKAENRSTTQDSTGGKSGEQYLSDALAKELAPRWPRPMMKYLHKEMTADGLLSWTAEDQDELTEAHCVIGLNLISQGENEEGIKHLQWVKEHGNREYQAYKLALVYLLHEMHK